MPETMPTEESSGQQADEHKEEPVLLDVMTHAIGDTRTSKAESE
jgi:hypothetical protein